MKKDIGGIFILSVVTILSFTIFAFIQFSTCDYIATEKATPYVLNFLRKGRVRNECISTPESADTSAMKINYVTSLPTPKVIGKYTIACNDYSTYVLVPYWSKLHDSIDAKFKENQNKIPY
jgi:hypothetical protein